VKRLLLLVSSIVLVESLFFSALSPLLPHFEDAFGLSKAESGLLVAAYAAGGFCGGLPSGALVTRLGAKATAIVGLTLLSSLSVVFGLAGEVWVLDLARFGQGVGSAFAWTGALTWLMAASRRERSGELIGIAMGAAIGGALLGPVLGGIATVVGTGAAFGGVAVIGFALAVWTWLTPSAPPEPRQPLRSLLAALREPEIVSGIAFLALPSLLFGVVGVLAPLRLDQLGMSELAISASFLVAAACEAGVSPALGRWSDRSGRLAPVRAALVGSIICAAILPWPDSRWTLAAVLVVASVFFGSFFVPGTALLSDGAERAGIGQGLGFALLNMAWAPGHVVGSAAGGAIADITGDALPYLLLAGICTLALLAVERGPLAVRSPKPAPTGARAS
jgi:predicted MFS family arabinose efflux permease